MPEITHPDVAGYLLGAVAPAEAAAFRAHMTRCEACSRESAALRELPAMLAVAGPPVEVPAGLGDRSLAAIGPPTLPAAPPRSRTGACWTVRTPPPPPS